MSKKKISTLQAEPLMEENEFLSVMEQEGVSPLGKPTSRTKEEFEEDWEPLREPVSASLPKRQTLKKSNIVSSTEVGPLTRFSWSRSEVSRKQIRLLKKGKLSIQDSLDLHGFTWKEARAEVQSFLQECLVESMTCVLIVHGKGHGQVLGEATLKSRLFHMLQQEPSVLAIFSALPKDGGLGASYVLLA